jgi:hypothetical protein
MYLIGEDKILSKLGRGPLYGATIFKSYENKKQMKQIWWRFQLPP